MRMKIQKRVALIAGVLAVVVGVVWIFQGINVLPGSFMTGDIDWSYRGGFLVAGGLVLIFVALRKPRSKS
jgi:hypothetical protein